MNREAIRGKQFGRRLAVLAGGQLGLFTLLAGRMYQLQVVEAERYAVLADENRISLKLLAPMRGRILDRTLEPLASNRSNYRVVLVPEQTGSIDATLDLLGHIIPIGDGDRRRVQREVQRKRRFLPIVVKDHLSWDEAARIAVSAPELPGVSIDVGVTREYPHGVLVAHTIGYVAPPAEADLTGDPLLELPDFRIGRNGTERIYDLALRGRAGASHVEVNALGRPIRELEREEGEAGHDVVLTIDLELQRLLADRLAQEESAAAVVLDVHNGDILAIASSPSFDPNDFNQGVDVATWRALTGNPRGPLTNKAIAGQYAPGSTFKVVVALAALESGTITPSFHVNCPGHMELGDHRFHCWKRGGHGSVDLNHGIRQSCDVFFYEVARRTGIDRIAAMARRLGLGRPVGIDLPGERPGLIPDRDWKLATIGQAWQQGETLVAGIGQGYVLATPLQLAVMTARVVNGGRAITPHLARDAISGHRVAERPSPSYPSIGVPLPLLATVARGMQDVVNSEAGTAFRSRIAEPGMQMGGKTGTSQVRRIGEEERRNGVRRPDQLPWRDRDHALFVAYAPIDAPRYAMAVIVEHGGGGSAVAAPIAREILLACQKRMRDRPSERIAKAEPRRGDAGG